MSDVQPLASFPGRSRLQFLHTASDQKLEPGTRLADLHIPPIFRFLYLSSESRIEVLNLFFSASRPPVGGRVWQRTVAFLLHEMAEKAITGQF